MLSGIGALLERVPVLYGVRNVRDVLVYVRACATYFPRAAYRAQFTEKVLA